MKYIKFVCSVLIWGVGLNISFIACNAHKPSEGGEHHISEDSLKHLYNQSPEKAFFYIEQLKQKQYEKQTQAFLPEYKSPDYGAYSATASWDSLQANWQKTAPHQAYLSYFITSQGIYIFCCQRKKISSFFVKVSQNDLEKSIEKMETLRTSSRSSVITYLQTAKQLNSWLIEPIYSAINGYELVISPDGALFNLDFAILSLPAHLASPLALIEESAAQNSFTPEMVAETWHNIHFLVEDFTISYIPFLNIWWQNTVRPLADIPPLWECDAVSANQPAEDNNLIFKIYKNLTYHEYYLLNDLPDSVKKKLNPITQNRQPAQSAIMQSRLSVQIMPGSLSSNGKNNNTAWVYLYLPAHPDIFYSENQKASDAPLHQMPPSAQLPDEQTIRAYLHLGQGSRSVIIPKQYQGGVLYHRLLMDWLNAYIDTQSAAYALRSSQTNYLNRPEYAHPYFWTLGQVWGQ